MENGFGFVKREVHLEILVVSRIDFCRGGSLTDERELAIAELRRYRASIGDVLRVKMPTFIDGGGHDYVRSGVREGFGAHFPMNRFEDLRLYQGGKCDE